MIFAYLIGDLSKSCHRKHVAFFMKRWLDKDLDYVEKLQRLATRTVKGFHSLSNEEELDNLIYFLCTADVSVDL